MFSAIVINKRSIFIGISVLLVILLVALATSIVIKKGLWTVSKPVVSQDERLVPIYYVETPEKKIAISFDACWGAERTPKILEILREYDIKTTFFLTGIWIREYPEWVATIAKKGHEFGNHSATHPHMSQLNAEQIEEELKEVERFIHRICRQRTVLFRPPFGEYNNTLIETAKNLGYKTIQWSIDSLDWQNHSKDAIVERVTSKAHNGAIVLFHNDGLHTPDALPEIIDFYLENGYEIVPISELVYQSNYDIDPNSGAQKPRR